ncbi:MAG: acetolactate synthase [Melioribacteraceae bacterium]|nr:MAG: acetolactate synthase [Melioribacteraceae bacterium]
MKGSEFSSAGNLKGTYSFPDNFNPELNKPAKVSGAEAIIKSLLMEGVETIFGYPGGAIMPVYDALYDYRDKVNHVLTRHEQGAVHAAQGYARASGKVGVCFATSGPGATNLITGIADAFIDSTPLVCITGQVGSFLLGTDAFQETDVVGISMPVTKWNYQVTNAEEIPTAIANAFYIAKSGRPGPVVIDITKDAQFSEFVYYYQSAKKIRSYQPKPKLNIEQVKAAATLINKSEKPLVLFGQGVSLSGADTEFRKFIEKTGIPAAWTLLGISSLPTTHPLNVGMLGMHGNYGPNKLTNEADLIIAIGMRFDDRVTGDLKRYATNAKIIHIEIDDAEIDKNVKTDVAVHADAKEALTSLVNFVDKKNHEKWLSSFNTLYDEEFDQVISKEIKPDAGKLRMAEVVKKLSEKTPDDTIVVTDVGQHQMVTARYFEHSGKSLSITSGGLGTMGFCLPASMGAKIGSTDKSVLAIIGDGGFQMTIQELATIAQYKIGIKIVVLNNQFLGMVRQWQELFFESRYSFTEMTNPDFVKIADGFGIPGRRLDQREHLDSSIDEMLSTEGPYFLEVMVEQEDNVFPMVPTGASVSEIRLS